MNFAHVTTYYFFVYSCRTAVCIYLLILIFYEFYKLVVVASSNVYVEVFVFFVCFFIIILLRHINMCRYHRLSKQRSVFIVFFAWRILTTMIEYDFNKPAGTYIGKEMNKQKHQRTRFDVADT